MKGRGVRYWLVLLVALVPAVALAARDDGPLHRVGSAVDAGVGRIFGREGRTTTEAAAPSAAETTADAESPFAVPALPDESAAAPAPEQGTDSLNASRRTAIVRAAERVSPAVVSVNVIKREAVQPRTLWESMMIPPGYEREVAGLGSGFIINPRGLVLTNDHVVHGATELVVTLPDGRDFPAEIVGTDEVNDVALLRLQLPANSAPLPVARVGSSANLMIGEWVVAIGNPLGFLLSNTEPTVTAGVVSGIHRNMLPSGQQEEGGVYLDMIQTDASINPGNSGGPLVNALGEVVGINSSILSQSGGSEGLGFAIPIDRARKIASDLLKNGRVRRPWVGIDVAPADTDLWGRSHEVRIAGVAPGSPAANAGLAEGAILLEARGRAVHTPLDWDAALLDAEVGQPLRVVVREAGQQRTVSVTPGDLPSMSAERIQALSDFQLVTVTPAIRSERDIASGHGALIVQLSDNARQQLGLEAGDVIVQINRTPIRDAQQAAEILGRLAGHGAVRFIIERDRQLVSTWFTIG